MKINTSFVVLLLFSILFSTNSFAQGYLNRLKKSAENAVGNAVERKIDQEMNKAAQNMVDNYWDKVIGKHYNTMPSQSGTSNTGSTSGQSSFPFTPDENVTLKESYSFHNAVHIEVKTFKKNGKLKETMELINHTNSTEKYVGTEMKDNDPKSKNEEIFIINDFDNNTMVMLMNNDGKKMRMAYGLTMNAQPTNYQAPVAENSTLPTFTNIGTKSILGYTCTGYQTINDDTETVMWVTEDDVFGLENMFSINKEQAKNLPSNYPHGSILEVESVETKSGEKVIMEVVKIEKDISLTKSMSDYPSYTTVED